jgi:anti-anti-sigma factor
MKSLEVAQRPLDQVQDASVLSLTGYLDAHTVAEFDKRADEVISAGSTRLVLDMQDLNYISSAGIGALMSLSQRLRKDGGDLVLLQPTAKVHKILDLLGFTKIFHLSNSEEEARALFQG